MSNPIINMMIDSMLRIERKDILIETCRNLFIEKDFSSMQKSVQKELKAIFEEDEDDMPVPLSPRFTLSVTARLLAKELNDDQLEVIGNEIIYIYDKGTLRHTFDLVKKRLLEIG